MLIKGLVLLFINHVIALQYSMYDLGEAAPHFDEFKTRYNKTYSDDVEAMRRFEIFKENLRHINLKNEEALESVHGITQFSDLTSEEFLAMYTGYIPSKDDVLCRVITDADITTREAPEEWDWRAQNAVTRVKNQFTCGSCWAFSVTGVIEGQYAIKHGQLVELSEQQLLDCDSYGSCRGGLPRRTFRELISMGGLQPESGYPYENRKNTCKFDNNAVVARVTDCGFYRFADEELIKELLFKVGPLSIAVDATSLQHYPGGILTNCPIIDRLNHGVVLVGYGTEQGVPYWVVKNSYSETWGESGYFRLMRGINACGLTGDISAAAIQ